MAPINNDWEQVFRQEYQKPYYQELYRFVNEEFGAEDDPYGKGMLVYAKEK